MSRMSLAVISALLVLLAFSSTPDGPARATFEDHGGRPYLRTTGGNPSTAEVAEAARLSISGGAAFDMFGSSVAISGDTIVVGAFGHELGAAYVFTAPGGVWTDMTGGAELTVTGTLDSDDFGWSVDISGDTVIVGAPGREVNGNFRQGVAYIFESGGGWSDMTEAATLTGDPGIATGFGSAVAIDGDTAVVGAPSDQGMGAIYVFEGGGGWDALTPAILTRSDGADDDSLGVSVAIDGNTVVAGNTATAPRVDAAYVFTRPGGNWEDMTETASLTPSDGDNSDNQHDDDFGISVAIEDATIVVGAHLDAIGHPPPDPRGLNEEEGSAYVFTRPPGGWGDMDETAKLTSSDGGEYDEFGISVGISDGTIVVGAYIADVEVSPGVFNVSQGAAYVFAEPAGGWSASSAQSALPTVIHETEKVTHSSGAEGDVFGQWVDIEDGTMVVGAGSAGNGAGAAYVFEVSDAPSNAWGDSDCDGEISTRDNQALLRKVLAQPALSQTEPCPDLGEGVTVGGSPLTWGNWDCDDAVSTRDNQALLRKILAQQPLSQTEPCTDIGES